MADLEFDCRFAYPAGFALDLQFRASDVTALVGPSGVGKTTVLNLIAGLLTPTSGRIVCRDEVFFDSRAGVNLPPEKRAIGYVFQDFLLFPHLTVLENLRYGEPRGGPAGVDWRRIVESLEIGDVLDRFPRTLSGGQKQRVAMGRAILRQPRLLLLDEPLNALDHALRRDVIECLARVLSEFSIPTLLVTHDQWTHAGFVQRSVVMA